MSKLYICRGIPGCGKSTYTKQMLADQAPKLIRVCKDEMRLMLHQTHRFGLEYMDTYNTMITNLWTIGIFQGFDVVLDETFMRRTDLTRVVEDAIMCGVDESEVLDFTKIPFNVIVRRDAGRHPSLGYAVLKDYQETLEREGETNQIVSSLRNDFELPIKVVEIRNDNSLREAPI
jgi:predicted kinase